MSKNILSKLFVGKLFDGESQKQIDKCLREIDMLKLNVKNLGYELAREMAASRLSVNNHSGEAKKYNLQSKASIQSDMESEWVSYWSSKLHIHPIYHRKIWELCYVPQVLYENDALKENSKGIVFGCGQEPLPSLFANMEADITVTDLHPDHVVTKGWAESDQHAGTLEKVFYPNIIEKAKFEENVEHKFVDMNDIPKELNNKYNFCWSVCALEHLGSIEKGLQFVENSCDVLIDGGVAVHTTEYNYTNENDTLDDCYAVAFQDKHFHDLKERLKKKGCELLTLNFDAGDGVLDRFVDVPPYLWSEKSTSSGFKSGMKEGQWWNINQHGHMKLTLDGFPCTCFGLIIRKNS